MKESVQNKINDIIAHSNINKDVKGLLVNQNSTNEDALLKSIRSESDAKIFIAELNAVIKVAKS